MKKYHVLVLLIILSTIWGCRSEKEESPVVARVGEAELSIDEVGLSLGTDSIGTTKDLERYIYRWVDDELLYQAALAEGIGSSPQVLAELRKVRRALIISTYLDKKLSTLPEIPEDRLLKHYSENQDEFVREQAEFRYEFVLCKERRFAQQVLRDIRKGIPFKKIVSDNYPDKVINSNWESGYVPLERVIPEIQRTIKRLKPGESFGPVATTSGYVVFKVLEKYDQGSTREFNLAKDEIRRRMEEEWYREQYQSLLGSLRSKKAIEINLDETGQTVPSDTGVVEE